MKKDLFKNVYLKSFLLGGLTAFCLLVPFWVADGGFFTYAGDFDSQQIPFYMYMNQMVKSGSMNWSWATDLGSSVINSYSFYLLGSPFFWLSCIFPYKAVPYIMPLLLILKFAVGNLGAFGYLRRYSKNDNYAMIGAVLYTFSGFSVYNIFFNHFLESVVFFPYLLWALDEFIYNKKRGIFPLIVALNLINNYFFFIGQVVFLFIYFGVKTYTKEYRINKKDFFTLAFESFTGCLMGIVLFIPSILSVLENPRSTSTLNGMGLWLYNNVQQYFAIIASALLPPDPPYIPALFTMGTIKWTSMSAFMAMGGMAGYFIFRKYNNNSSFGKIFTISVISALVPVLNSTFYAFNSAYYARWFYMPLLMLSAMNMQSFTLEKQQIFYGLKTTAVLTLCLSVFALTPSTNDEGEFILGIAEEPAIFILNIMIALLSIYLAFFVVYNHKDKPHYTKRLMSGCLIITMLFGCTHLALTKMPQWEADKLYKPQNYDVLDSYDFTFGETEANWRMDTYNCYDNMGLFINMPNLQFFNSTVTPSIMEFYPAVGVKRDVSSKPDRSLYALRTLLSVKYIVMPEWEESNFLDSARNANYYKINHEYPYTVYENMNFVTMGFAYDKYVEYDQLSQVNSLNRSNVLVRALAVDGEVIEKYNLGLKQLSDSEMFDYTYTTFIEDVTKRRNLSAYYFQQTDDGFQCKINLNQPNLVFFSVPYDTGFTAWVNGEKTEIEKVNYGLCAVYAPAGDNEIIFTYRTPGLTIGITTTVIGWAVYAGCVLNIKRKHKEIQ
ncbi:MAG: YfhO family protein [Oscillospiraceae bacterium]|nr:YfhO family protein [Oscillospiraceae bacterium]